MGESRVSRTEFIEGYAKRSGISAEWAPLGFIEVGGAVRIALPCGCEEEKCKGWAMVSADSVSSHLELYAPYDLRDAFCSYLSTTLAKG